MPKRRKSSTLTSRDIKNLQNASPYGCMVFVVFMMGIIIFIVGIFLIISFTGWLNNNFELPNGFTINFPIFAILTLVILIVALIIGISIALINNYNKEVEKKYKGMRIANIDSMTGIEFEQYLKRVLTNRGYSVSMTSASGDLGVDLVALGNDNKIAIQAKRYSKKVSRRAISDAVAGMYHYGCNRAMVITNNYFSPGAIELAQSTGCILIDRDTLAQWINEFQDINIGNLVTENPSKIESK